MSGRTRVALLIATLVGLLGVAGGAAWRHAHATAASTGDTDRMDADEQHQLMQEIGYIK